MSDRASIENSLGEALYLAFWQRNDWADTTLWTNQSPAIQKMWTAIAGDAIDLLPVAERIAARTVLKAEEGNG